MLGIAALIAVGCASAGRTTPPPEESKAAAISSVEPRYGDFTTKPEPVPHRPAVASRGGCEPRYKSGRTGTCINDKPCRGFGVLENEQVACMCFAVRGGCEEGYRCDPRGTECVKEDEEEFNRSP
jgi:hypothetical protein